MKWYVPGKKYILHTSVECTTKVYIPENNTENCKSVKTPYKFMSTASQYQNKLKLLGHGCDAISPVKINIFAEFQDVLGRVQLAPTSKSKRKIMK